MLSTGNVAELSGASRRQLQTWDEAGILKPIKGKHLRHWDEVETALAIVIADRRRKGIVASMQRNMSDKLRRVVGDLVNQGESWAWVACNGERVCATQEPEKIVRFLEISGGLVTLTRANWKQARVQQEEQRVVSQPFTYDEVAAAVASL